MIVRLGAMANAITSVATISAGTLATGVGAQRDVLQANLVLMSYFNEAIEAIDNKRAWELVEGGIRAGYRFPQPLDAIRQAFSRGKNSIYKELLGKVRRTKGFHVDPEHFQEWLDTLMAEEVVLWQKDTASPLDWAFGVSAQIQSFFGVRLREDHLPALSQAVMLVNLVEAMTGGLLLEAGVQPASCVRRMSRRLVNVEFSFKDGRRDFCTWFLTTVDDTGNLQGSASDLRDKVTEVFGGERVGALVPGTHSDIDFHANQRGRAFGWLSREVKQRNTSDPARELLSRARQMSGWGVLRSQRMLNFVDSVRAGTAIPGEIETLTNELRADLHYWRERQSDIEVFTRAFRNAMSD